MVELLGSLGAAPRHGFAEKTSVKVPMDGKSQIGCPSPVNDIRLLVIEGLKQILSIGCVKMLDPRIVHGQGENGRAVLMMPKPMYVGHGHVALFDKMIF